ncbi:FliM/FliN family flagellar motor switch protein [Iodidimonas sp. SYSU 1G8]|uniref:FliM/FliN family flagellar motor switch protein n=1 Tax=Iodidimonas sp. SYSU 1G8 TaxID=3133967 RepID=UPI0031FF15EA
MSALDDITVDLTIVLGFADVPIRQMLKMGRGSMIPLNCGHDDPTVVYVNDQLIAEGKIVVEGDRMSLEVTGVAQKGR